MRVAGVQAAPVFLDADATVAKAVSLIEEAAANGAELVAFAESWLPGYPSWIFGAAGWEDAGREGGLPPLPRERRRRAVAGDRRALPRRAGQRRRGRHGHDGAGHRHLGGSLYNSLLYISAEGAILGVHRKLMPTHAERIVWGQGTAAACSSSRPASAGSAG